MANRAKRKISAREAIQRALKDGRKIENIECLGEVLDADAMDRDLAEDYYGVLKLSDLKELVAEAQKSGSSAPPTAPSPPPPASGRYKSAVNPARVLGAFPDTPPPSDGRSEDCDGQREDGSDTEDPSDALDDEEIPTYEDVVRITSVFSSPCSNQLIM
jgi:hypothetical protein